MDSFSFKLALARDLAVAPTTAFGEVEQETTQRWSYRRCSMRTHCASDTSKVPRSRAAERRCRHDLGSQGDIVLRHGASGVVAQDAKQKFMRSVLAECELDPHLQLTRVSLLDPMTWWRSPIRVRPSTLWRFFVLPGRLAHAPYALPTIPAPVRSNTPMWCWWRPASESSLRGGALASRIAQLSVVDCLFVLSGRGSV